mgnify:CR=1 FL=1
MSEMVAPFTLRIAISLRRCSHDRLIKENIPKTAIIPQTIDATYKHTVSVVESMYFL